MTTMEITPFTPSTLQVDFDKNITKMYEAITSSDWDLAIACAEQRPTEAKTWVVRHYEEEGGGGSKEVMWRFLPIHSACARQPPAALIEAIIKAYPDSVRCVDDQGMYPLHYACGNQASRDVIRQLLMAYPQASKKKDPRGMLPIHYLACWGPSSISVVDMVLVANREIAFAQDIDGNTPMNLAREGEYAGRDGVIAALKRWATGEGDAESKKKDTLSTRSTSKGSIVTTDALHQKTFGGNKDAEILRLRQELAQAHEERDDLRQTLSELAAEHDKMKIKSVMLGDRLGSLNASLYGMMEEQNAVLTSLRKREDKWNSTATLRRQKMRELLQLEEEGDSETVGLKECFLKQTKEMEAIQAVIAAVRAGK